MAVMGFTIYGTLVIRSVFVSLLSLGLATAIGIHSVGTAVIAILLALVIAGGITSSISASPSELAHTAGEIVDGNPTTRNVKKNDPK